MDKNLINEYLADHKNAWAESTIKSETARLNSIQELLGATPAEVHERLITAGYKPYTIKTIFMRLVSIETWAMESGKLKTPNFRLYMRKHRNKFKYAYQKEEVKLTYTQAKNRIMKLPDPYRAMALGMLTTGLRLSEVYKFNDGSVIGKGGKQRKVYDTIKGTAPRGAFSRQLKAVGLKSHTLRKLCATRVAELGATPADLCKIFGWSSINTAYQYLQAKDDDRLQALIQKAAEET